MQSLSPRDREAISRRRSRLECTLCGQLLDLPRLRAHLRESHRLESARLDQVFTDARRTALRGRTRDAPRSLG